MIDPFKIDGRHFLHDSELADAIAGMDFGIAQGDGVELPDVVFATIFLFDDSHGIREDDAEFIECGAARK